MTAPDARSTFVDALVQALQAGRLQRLVLSAPRGGAEDLQRCVGRPVLLRGQTQLSLVTRHATRDLTRNLPVDTAAAAVRALLDAGPPAAGDAAPDGAPDAAPRYAQALLETDGERLSLRIARKGRAALSRQRLAGPGTAGADPGTPPTQDSDADDGGGPIEGGHGPASAAAHDRAKQRWLDPAAAWLHRLGVTEADGRVIPAMSRKWKQINKFVEVLDAGWRDSALAQRPAGAAPLRVMDFGAGRGYLTCAVAAWLNGRGQPAEVVGVELRADLVAQVNAVARADSAAEPGGEGPLAGLRFEQGDVGRHATGALDVMIALHACDTATDHAIHRGIAAGAQLIVCSPCCHKELRPQLRAPGLLAPLLRHGIHLGQQAEMITDGLRALLLEAHGYEARVFEFVSLEHTAKNKMILALRRAAPLPAEPVLAQIRAIKDFYGVREQCLEALLARPAPPPADSPAR
ncbi:class I SAM-dependent methyltransferase [Piscinibacter sakaiensis]|uniref:Methyltransferase n=2 Tax=Piscinibacter sakaiensis TaxID=1547922 RepID=A0A0K8NYP3_PISS1|nr:SAM-dependent methyltransferase [Piscinibacter sakaiensis]GAP35501.1 methyltransferase [Piscinibacter sakaiensis]